MKHLKIIFYALAGLNFVALSPSCALAAEISDRFASGNDTAWTRHEPLASHGGGSVFSFPDGGYRLQADASPNPDELGATRLGSFRLDFSAGSFSQDFDLLGWNPNLNQSFGVLGRASDFGFGSTDGYYFAYSTEGFISISRIDNEQLTILASAPLFLDPLRHYSFAFQGFGPDFFGGVYDPENGNRIVSGIAVSDNSYDFGVTGFYLQSNVGNGGVDATFDNFRAFTLVPEPSTLSLFVMAGLAGFWLARRRRNIGQ